MARARAADVRDIRVMTKLIALTCTSLAVGLTVLSSSRAEAVDVVAVRAYLRTQADGGEEVTSPTLGQAVFVHIAYRLEGLNQVTARVRAFIDGELFCNGPLELHLGNGRVWCDSSWPATAGTHVLRWRLDADDQINESDEDNNEASFVFQVGAPTGDLVATRAFLRTGLDGGDEVINPQPGQHVFVTVGIRLDGVDFGLPARLRALIDGEQHCGGPVDIDPGDNVVRCTNPWTATPGEHTLRWEVDTDNLIGETSEANNTVETSFNVGAATVDLIATRAFLRGQAGEGMEIPIPALGQDIFFEVGYRLTSTSAKGGNARADIDGERHCGGVINFQPGDGITVYCPNAWTAVAGTHLLLWTLDPLNVIVETDETNNESRLVFGVGGPADDANCDARRDAADLVAAVGHIAAGTRAACLLDDADASRTLDAADVGFIERGIFTPL